MRASSITSILALGSANSLRHTPCARQASVDTPTTGKLQEYAKPCTALAAILKPVKDPGP
jgi:hypothetical protein